MPWNDNANPGPWGSPPSGDDGGGKEPPKRPSGGGGGGPRRPGGPGGPDLNAGLNNLRNRMRGFLGGPGQGVRPGAIAAVAAAAFALWALSGIYQVASNEEAVVTRFGAFERVEAPGLRYHLPSPVEHVEKVAVTSLNRLDIRQESGRREEARLGLPHIHTVLTLVFKSVSAVAFAEPPRCSTGVEPPRGRASLCLCACARPTRWAAA